MAQIRAVLTDIDGVLAISWRPVPGAVRAVTAIREAGYPIALLTNTSSRTRGWIAAALRESGFPVSADDILTVATLTAAYLNRKHPGARCLLLNDGELSEDLPGVRLVGADDPDPDVVILGGAGPQFDYQALNHAFACVRRGASLIAMNRNLYWQTDAGLRLDTGAFLPGLEQAAGVQAEVTGKPAAAFFSSALGSLGVPASQAIMVGDDINGDVLAAQRLGITGVLVKTGKYRPDTHHAAPAAPDHVIDSVAGLPDLLSRLACTPDE
jgi:HAD superfamily hydrolase (TIGR01458 family)